MVILLFNDVASASFLMLALSSSVLLFLSSSVSASLYVRPIVGHTVEGKVGRVFAPEDGNVLSCVKEWSFDPPAIVLFNETTKTCSAVETVYGSKDDRNPGKSYLLTRSDANQCLRNAVEDIKLTYSCMPGWHQISLDNSVECYQPMSSDVYVKYNTSGTPDDFLRACKEVYPFADAASLHSRQEESLIGRISVETFQSLNAKSPSFYGFKIGLRLRDANDSFNLEKWLWVDGSSMDYDLSFNMTHPSFEGYYKSHACSHAALFWRENGSNILIACADYNSRDLLCKYTLRKN